MSDTCLTMVEFHAGLPDSQILHELTVLSKVLYSLYSSCMKIESCFFFKILHTDLTRSK